MGTKIIALPGAKTVGQLFNRLIRKPLATWRAREKAYDELMALDDHMLADIGIVRSEIPGIIRGEIKLRRASNENQPNIAA